MVYVFVTANFFLQMQFTESWFKGQKVYQMRYSVS